MAKPLTPEEFWALLDRAGDCWTWPRSTTRPGGYGRIMIRGRKVLTHHFAWELTSGAIPDGMRVLHRCDNPRCVRPDHLFLGTQADNVHDMWAKGRADHRGERNGRARLTPDDVRQIRQLSREGVGYRPIARRFGVASPTVRDIVKGWHWAHVA